MKLEYPSFLVFLLFDLGQTDCVKTQSDWVSLLPGPPQRPQTKIQPPSDSLYDLVPSCLSSFISCHFSSHVDYSIKFRLLQFP